MRSEEMRSEEMRTTTSDSLSAKEQIDDGNSSESHDVVAESNGGGEVANQSAVVAVLEPFWEKEPLLGESGGVIDNVNCKGSGIEDARDLSNGGRGEEWVCVRNSSGGGPSAMVCETSADDSHNLLEKHRPVRKGQRLGDSVEEFMGGCVGKASGGFDGEIESSGVPKDEGKSVVEEGFNLSRKKNLEGLSKGSLVIAQEGDVINEVMTHAPHSLQSNEDTSGHQVSPRVFSSHFLVGPQVSTPTGVTNEVGPYFSNTNPRLLNHIPNTYSSIPPAQLPLQPTFAHPPSLPTLTPPFSALHSPTREPFPHPNPTYRKPIKFGKTSTSEVARLVFDPGSTLKFIYLILLHESKGCILEEAESTFHLALQIVNAKETTREELQHKLIQKGEQSELECSTKDTKSTATNVQNLKQQNNKSFGHSRAEVQADFHPP